MEDKGLFSEGLKAIIDEVNAPCAGKDQPCSACIEIGVRKAYRLGFTDGRKAGDAKVAALLILKHREE